LLREQILALSEEQKKQSIVLDEIQKVPPLLDEVHWLTENHNLGFILCGSSARKLKREAANLLGGRAWVFHFFPLCSQEIPGFDLLQAFNNGLLPSIYPQNTVNAKRSLKAYVEAYITEEVKGEGLVRNLPAFARFMESLRFSHGEIINFTNIAREVGVDSKTVQEYYNILIDTLLGFFIPPFRKQASREIIKSAPKFYLMDTGVANYICNRHVKELSGIDAGKSLEHLILLELLSFRALKEKEFSINYWRTKTGIEVDFILDAGNIAIEVKISRRVDKKDFHGLAIFAKEYKPKRLILICLEEKRRKVVLSGCEIEVIPVLNFFESLWGDEIL
jgi:predicted AAA+ superfamily ATPase